MKLMLFLFLYSNILNTLIYYIAYMTIKDSKYIKINSANPLYLIITKVKGYFEENNKNRYLTLFPWKQINNKKYEELWSKIRDLISQITKKSDDYDER